MILVHDLAYACQPIVQIRVVGLDLVRLGRAVEGRVARIIDVGIEGGAAVVKPPVLGAVRRRAKMQSLFAHGRGQLAHHVALRPHLRGAPLRKVGGVHRETIMMLSDGHHVLRPGLPEQLRPLLRIELFGFEHGDEVLVAEL